MIGLLQQVTPSTNKKSAHALREQFAVAREKLMSPSTSVAAACGTGIAPPLPVAAPAASPKSPRVSPSLWLPRVDSLAEFGLMISRQLTQCRRFGGQLAVLWLETSSSPADASPWSDTDRLALVQAVGRRLRSRVRGTDLVLQVGETSFAVLLIDAGEREADIVRLRLAAALDTPYGVGAELMNVAVHMGTATFPEGGHRGADLAESARRNLRRCP